MEPEKSFGRRGEAEAGFKGQAQTELHFPLNTAEETTPDMIGYNNQSKSVGI